MLDIFLLTITLFILCAIRGNRVNLSKTNRSGRHKKKFFVVRSCFAGIIRRSALEYNMKNTKLFFYTKRYYTTNNSIKNEFSDRLKETIKELNLNPVYLFENLNLESTKLKIKNSTTNLSGIYMVLNKTTKDYYVGSAATDKFYSRFANHVIYSRGSKIVKLAVKKYGIENFAFIVLDLYPHVVTKENNQELLLLEDKYLKLLLPNYNILTEAGSSFGYKHTQVDRQKMKDIYSDERREQIGNLNRGKKLSLETIEKLRNKALLRPPMSEETKLKCISNTRPVTLFNLDRTVYGRYTCLTEAAKAINCNEKTIRRALFTEKKIVKKQ